MYLTDAPIKAALQEFLGDVVVATKSTAPSYADMETSILGALQSLGRDYLDIFYLHAANVTPNVFTERAGAFQCLLDYKQKGYIRAVGISTHVVPVVEKAAELPEIDVVFPLINRAGLGIIGGSADEMKTAIHKASQNGKGVVAMKVLGGGNLIGEIQDAFAYVRGISGVNTVAVGMKNPEEIELNLRLFRGEDIPVEELRNIRSQKELFISRICEGCGICVEKCPSEALEIHEGKAVVNKQKCILCGYCNPYCPNFAIRMV
jgi:predicted aldo/keto reductase-like oxidoreductase